MPRRGGGIGHRGGMHSRMHHHHGGGGGAAVSTFVIAPDDQMLQHENDWKSSLFGCCGSSAAIDACFCHYCASGRQTMRLENADETIGCCSPGCIITCVGDCAGFGIMGATHRAKIRAGVMTRYKIKGSFCASACIPACCCGPCSVAQHANEMISHDEHPGSTCCGPECQPVNEEYRTQDPIAAALATMGLQMQQMGFQMQMQQQQQQGGPQQDFNNQQQQPAFAQPGVYDSNGQPIQQQPQQGWGQPPPPPPQQPFGSPPPPAFGAPPGFGAPPPGNV